MIESKRILALITARGGSKGVPGKNIRLLGGKPLISYTVEAALASRFIDRVIVSTDSEEIAAASRKSGADVPFMRPLELSGDLARQEDAILHAMRWFEENGGAYDIILVLTPTTPLRTGKDIDDVIGYFASHPRARSVITVIEAPHAPQLMNTLPPDLSLQGFVPEDLKFKNRQELPQAYCLSGSVCLADWDYFKAEGSFLAPLAFAYVVDVRSGFDINTPLDFQFAEFLFSLGDAPT